eukprot:gene1124-2184_t
MFSFPSMSFNSAGSNLVGLQKQQFDEIKALIDNGTNEMLIQPDWDVNLRCCDLVKNVMDQDVIHEVVAAIRRKMNSKTHMKVFFALTMIETLVKNCGERMYVAINDEGFLKDMAKVVKKYQVLARNGRECRDVAELSADIIQAWGEAFLSRSRQYPNISRAYHELRKEGIQFKPQYDESRVPIFTNTRPVSVVNGTGNDYIDDDLAAALQASLGTSGGPGPGPGSRTSTSASNRSIRNVMTNHHTSDIITHEQQQQQQPTMPSMSVAEVISAVNSSSQMLHEMICALTSVREAQGNELMEDVELQLKGLLKLLNVMLEGELGAPETVELMFRAIEVGNRVMSVFEDVKKGSCTISKAASLLSQNKVPVAAQQSPSPPAKQSQNYATQDPIDLLFSNYTPDVITPAATAAPVSHPQSHSHLFVDESDPFGPSSFNHSSTGSSPNRTSPDNRNKALGHGPGLLLPPPREGARKMSVSASAPPAIFDTPAFAPSVGSADFDPLGAMVSSKPADDFGPFSTHTAVTGSNNANIPAPYHGFGDLSSAQNMDYSYINPSVQTAAAAPAISTDHILSMFSGPAMPPTDPYRSPSHMELSSSAYALPQHQPHPSMYVPSPYYTQQPQPGQLPQGVPGYYGAGMDPLAGGSVLPPQPPVYFQSTGVVLPSQDMMSVQHPSAYPNNPPSQPPQSQTTSANPFDDLF